MANPFLMESDYGIQQPSSQAASVFSYSDTSASAAASANPFLSFGGAPEPAQASVAPMTYDMGYNGTMATAAGGGGDNPFLSYGASTGYDNGGTSAATAPSNPFADFGAPAAPVSGGAAAYYSSSSDMAYSHQTMYNQPEPELQLIDTEPVNIPSTQNLLQSVTGVLEKTSDSLMERVRVNVPSPTPDLIPSTRSPSPDLLLGEEPPAPPPSANPLAPSPIPPQMQTNNIMDIFDTGSGKKEEEKPPIQPQSTSATIDLLGLYNSTPTPAPEPPKPMEIEQPPPPPVEQPMVESLVDLVVEPATPLRKEYREEPPPPPKAETPTQLLSPEEKVKSPPGKPPPPRPQPPSPARSPAHSPTKEQVPPARPAAPPPSRPTPPKSPQPSRPPPPPVVQRNAAPSVTSPPTAAPISEPQVTPSPFAAPVPEVPISSSPFAAPVSVPEVSMATSAFAAPAAPTNIFAAPEPQAPAPVAQTNYTGGDIFGSRKPQPAFANRPGLGKTTTTASFDAFDAKFESAVKPGGAADAFGPPTITTTAAADTAWGGAGEDASADGDLGFGDSGFDSFLALTEPPPVPQSTPSHIGRRGGGSDDDDEDKEMSVVIRPKGASDLTLTIAPALAPPPKSPCISTGSAFSEENATAAYVPFLSQSQSQSAEPTVDHTYSEMRKQQQQQLGRTESQESAHTPLFEEDTSQPLEDFPRTKTFPEGWDMFMRYPNKKSSTPFGTQRTWRPVWVQLERQGDISVVKVYGKKGDREPLQEVPLQASYSISDISAQQFDQYGKIFTAKIQFVYYKERPGVRPGQIGRASRLTNKLSAFAQYAITGDPSGVKEIGSELKKLGLPLEHAPQASQLVKLGSNSFDEMKQFSICIEEALFRLATQRDRAMQYKTEEIQVTIVDEYYVEQDILGVVTRQIARVRLFFLSFLNGLAEIEMGVNDLRRQGKEIVGRHDIIPVPTEEWIRMEDIEFSNIVELPEFEETQTIKFKPPDAGYLELMRFRVRPPRHRELPLQVKTTFTTMAQNKIEIRSDILVPGYQSRGLGQIPCEDVMIRFPIPENWIYMFRVEKHFRYGSVKSAHRRSGKVKGVERILGALDVVEPSLMETTSGQAKYEHHHRAIVWRIARLPKEGQGAYTTHSFFCHITLQPHEKVPENLTKHCYVEFTMPHTTVSHTVCRSISVPTSDEPPEKCCRYLSRHEYVVEVQHLEGLTQASYSVAAAVDKKPEEDKPERGEFEENKYDSDFSDD